MKRQILIYGMVFMNLVSLQASEAGLKKQEEMVKALYSEHQGEKGVLVNEQRRSEWKRWFTPELIAELDKERGFDPLFFGQDFEIKNLKVKALHDGEDGQGLVLVSFFNFGEPIQLVVAMKKVGESYRIQNIVQPATGNDLLNDLANES